MKKIETIKFLGILGIIVIICSNFLQMHFSSDTYVLYRLGYFNYPSEYFLQDGRLISTLFCYLGGILHLPIPAYIIAMDFLGMVFLAISIYLISRVFKDIIKPKSLLKEVLIYLASFILILNQYTLEYLLFPESAVMCMGVLFTVLAIKEFVSDSKNKYLKIFIYLLITGLSYQGELNIFPVLAILVLIVKQIVEKQKIKVFLKESIIELLKIMGIAISVLIICTLIVNICADIFNSKKESMMLIRNETMLRRKLNLVKFYSRDILIKEINMLPKYSIIIYPFIILAVLVTTKAKIQTIINYIVYILISFASVVLPLFIITAAVCARLSLPAMMIFGGSLLILLANTNNELKEWKKKLISIFVILIFILNAGYIIQNTTQHIAANKIDENDGKQIKYLLEKYEEETGNRVTKFAYKYDPNPQQYAPGIKAMESLTERKLACVWCIEYAMQYYCERDLELVPYNDFAFLEDNLEKMYDNRNIDYECFTSEQITFKDDTIYMVVY